MMTHDEIHQQLSDYALGLLPRRKLDLVEAHLAHCSTCRDALQVERNIGQLVQGALQVAAQPDVRRLRALMPQPPQPRRLPWQNPGWQKQLAPLLIILTLLIGAFASQQSLPSGSNLPGFVVTAYAATATSTNTPTATAVTDDFVAEVQPPVQSEQVKQDLPPDPSTLYEPLPNTPHPQPTPVAAAGQLMAQ